MNEKESFHDVWVAADKPQIDIMEKTSNPLSKAPHPKNSSEGSDSKSDSSSAAYFSAVPREFWSNLELNKSPTKDGEPKTIPNQCSNLSSPSQPFKHRGKIRSHMNNKAVRRHNSVESSNLQFTDVLQKSACVRWDSTLSLNKSSKSSDFAFPKPETKSLNFNKPPNSDKIEKNFVREERTFISATRLDDDESDSDHEPIYEKAVNFTYDKKFIQGTSRDSSQNAKSNGGWEVNGKRCFLNTEPMQNTCKQHSLHLDNNADWGRPINSGTRFCKNSPKEQSIKAPNFQQTNINVNQKTETLPQAWIQKQHNYTTHEENDQTHCKKIDVRKPVSMRVTNTSKFTYEVERNSQNKCDQYVNLSNENLHQKKMDNYDLPVQKESLSQVKSNNARTAEEKQLIEYGKEISDHIIGSYTTLSIFISFHNEWSHERRELIKHFEELEVFLKDSCKNNNRLKDVLKIANTGTTIATNLPIPHISVAAKVISVLTGLVSVFISEKNTEEVDDEDPEIVRLLVKDIEASTQFYMHCLICNQQFEETRKLIEKFHSSAIIREFFDSDCEDIANFLRGVLEYNPMQHIFYKKLHKCFQELLQKGSSELSRRFCEPFLLHSSNAVDVIECLEWRFVEDFDNTSVKYVLEEIHKLIENSNSTSMSDLLKKIRNCIPILKDELNYVEKSVSKVSLFDNSFENKKLDPK